MQKHAWFIIIVCKGHGSPKLQLLVRPPASRHPCTCVLPPPPLLPPFPLPPPLPSLCIPPHRADRDPAACRGLWSTEDRPGPAESLVAGNRKGRPELRPRASAARCDVGCRVSRRSRQCSGPQHDTSWRAGTRQDATRQRHMVRLDMTWLEMTRHGITRHTSRFVISGTTKAQIRQTVLRY